MLSSGAGLVMSKGFLGSPLIRLVYFGWFLGVADHQMTSLLACYQPLQILIWANECKIFVGLSVPTNSLTTFDLHN